MAGIRVVALRRSAARFRRVATIVAALAAAVAQTSCDDGRTRVVVRTDLPEEIRGRVEAAFEAAHPDVDVRFSAREDGATGAELRDGDQPPFDVWWGGPAATMEALVRDGRLAGWTPWASSPFVVLFDRDRVSLTNAPTDWIDVLHHGWTDEVLVPDPTRSRSGAAFTHGAVAESARLDGDAQVGFDWLERLDSRVLRYVADADEAVRGIRMGVASLAIVPLTAIGDGGQEETLHHRRPPSRDVGLFGGVGLTRAEGPEAEAAARFVAFLTADATMEVGLGAGWEHPVDEMRTDVTMVVDSSAVWLTRWRETIRGRGK